LKSSIFIPKTINVGFQNRSDTYTGKLGYVIYYDEKGKLRKEASWNSWRDENIPNEEFEETFNDTISFLMSKIENFEPEKVSEKTGKAFKAYSYCGTICKNYLLHKRIEYSKELERASSYDTMCEELNDDLRYSSYVSEHESLLSDVIDGAIFAIKDIMNGNVKGNLTEKEILVGQSLINLLENWEDILIANGSNKLNKSAILYYLRETTRLTTKEVRDSMKKYKKAYFGIKEKIMKDF
jgi:hypothetical protein